MARTSLKTLPIDVQHKLARGDLIVFDGVCLLCAGFTRFVMRYEARPHFHFATAQSDLGQTLYRAMGLSPEAFDTLLVVLDGKIYTKTHAVGAVMARMVLPWRVLALLVYLPAWSTDWAYDVIARNRYRLFGRRAECEIPDTSNPSRFLT